MPKIADRGIAKLYTTLDKKRESDFREGKPDTTQIGQEEVLKVLAEVGDKGWGASAKKVLKQLQAPGLTPQQQVDIAKKGMTDAERTDIEQILDQTTIPFQTGVKVFLEAVVGRAAAPATHPEGWVTGGAQPFAPYTNVIHFDGPATFQGAKLKPEVLAGAFHGVAAEKFGMTEVLLPQPDGTTKTATVRDMHYDLGDGKVGMNLIPVKDHDAEGNKQMDEFLRQKMDLKPNEPIFAILSYLHPEEHAGDMKALGTKMLKTEGGSTHMGAYVGGGRTTNSPEDYHQKSWEVKGYPANVQVVSLLGVPQGELNKNLVAADSVLNYGVKFPNDYKNDPMQTVDLNTTLQFYRDWLKDEPYLKEENSWKTYCAEHKTIVTNVGVNVPHNLESFKEIFGQEEGAKLFDTFKAKFKVANGRDFTAADETHFEPLWKKEGLTSKQIKPWTRAEFDAYHDARIANKLGPTAENPSGFTGTRPLPPGVGLAWQPETTADLVKNFMETYASFKNVGGYAAAATILGFKDNICPRMGIDEKTYIQNAAPILNKLMVAEAMARAPGDAAGLAAWSEKAAAGLYLAFGGNQADFAPGGTIDQGRMGLAKMCMQGVAGAGADIIRMANQPAEKRNDLAYGWMRGAIEADMQQARSVAVSDRSKTEMYSPPAVTNRVANGLVGSSKFIKIKVVATAVDASEVQ